MSGEDRVPGDPEQPNAARIVRRRRKKKMQASVGSKWVRMEGGVVRRADPGQEGRPTDFSSQQVLFAAVLFLAFAVAQALIGGARMVWAIPAYGLVALAALASVRMVFGKPEVPRMGCVVVALLFAGYVLLRAVLSPVGYLARPDVMIALGSLCVYLLTAFYFVGVRARMLLCGLMFLPAFAHVIAGLIQFKEGDNFMAIPWFMRFQYGSRASGFYICPNHLAGMLELLGVMALSIVVWARWRAWARMLAFYAVIVCYAGVAITGSRGGYLSSAFSLGVFAILTLTAIRTLSKERFWRMIPLVLAGVGALVAGALFLMFKSDFLKFRVEMISDSSDVRWLLWVAAVQQFFLNPVWGTGAGTYLIFGRQFRADQVQNDPIFVHNDYLHLLAEYGVVGALLLVPFLVLHFSSGARAVVGVVRKRMVPEGLSSSNSLALVIGATSAASAYLVHSVVDFNLHIPANALFVAFLFGVMANPGVWVVRVTTRGSAAARALRWSVPLCGLALAAFAMPKLAGEYYAERARVFARDAMWPEAVHHATVGVGLDPKNPDLYFYLAETLRTQGFWSTGYYPFDTGTYTARAAEWFRRGLEVFPQDIRLLYRMGCALDTMMRYGEAEKYYLRALEADPNFSNSHAFYAVHLHQQRRLEEAEKHYRKALRLESGNHVARQGLAELLEIKKKREEKPGRYSGAVE